jgi:hypothetical protein
MMVVGNYPDPPPPDPDIIGGEQHYRVEGLYNHRYHNGHLQYFVKFEGYPMEQGEWLFIADLRGYGPCFRGRLTRE